MKFHRRSVVRVGALLSVLAGGLWVASPSQAFDPPATIATISAGELSIWTRESGSVDVHLPLPVYRSDLTAAGDLVAVTTGIQVTDHLEGVIGQLQVIDTSSLVSVMSTNFNEAILTDVSISPDGKFVAFVKDYTELWLLDVALGQARKLTDAPTLAPATMGSVVMSPTFASDSRSIYVVVVEKTFAGGEDDKLDNIWKVSLLGTATKYTNLTEGSGLNDWLIVRQPIAMPNGNVMYSTATSGTVQPDTTDPSPFYAVSISDPNGNLKTLSQVPPMTMALDIGDDEIFFFKFDNYTYKWDLVVMGVPAPSEASWTTWCEAGCETLMEDVDWASVATGA